jgi:hypothetical protein
MAGAGTSELETLWGSLCIPLITEVGTSELEALWGSLCIPLIAEVGTSELEAHRGSLCIPLLTGVGTSELETHWGSLCIPLPLLCAGVADEAMPLRGSAELGLGPGVNRGHRAEVPCTFSITCLLMDG